ncbi:ATP synthase F1 subunit delta [Buchnera aphidicola (Hormaphis cornu)]|nr:ATP synthase F1 subunit delta [Buchnera aphidicola (Hormaphis cornu)]
MLTLAAKISEFNKLNIISLDILGPHNSAKIFIEICKENIDDYFCNFIKIIALNKRLSLFKTILTLFYEYWDFYNKILNIEVISSKKLNKLELINYNTLFQKKFLKKIRLNCKIDKSLIYGIKFQLKDFVIEKTICIYLQQLKKFLQK